MEEKKIKKLKKLKQKQFKGQVKQIILWIKHMMKKLWNQVRKYHFKIASP